MIHNLSSIPQPLPTEPPTSLGNADTQTHSLSRSRRNIGEPGKYWPQNSTIKIAMYDYEIEDEYVQAVMRAANQWLPHINLKFEFVTGDEGDVRISQNLRGDTGGSSAIGTDSQNSPWLPSMLLPRNHEDPRFEYVVMHEFGHMLGAHHAHQHPDAHIPWHSENVYTGYRRLANLDRQGVQDEVLPLPRSSTYDFLPYDMNSVMHYHVYESMTHDDFGITESWSISDGDIAWAKKAYPRAPEQP
ncbi:peptidase M12 [Pseudomonas cedrina subsp. fulgida]|nr:peptidase M12 [Pseudomonas cedrina subsp. fulgida]